MRRLAKLSPRRQGVGLQQQETRSLGGGPPVRQGGRGATCFECEWKRRQVARAPK
jgi:hypothetical protein